LLWTTKQVVLNICKKALFYLTHKEVCMTRGFRLVVGTMLFLGLAMSSANADVYVFGMVMDTLKNPVAGVQIIISRMQGGMQPIDTLTSGTDGKFAQKVVYAQNLSSVRYSASKTGYLTATGNADVVRDTADLDTIRLRSAGAPDSIFVVGLVLDTAKKPIADVRIIISGGTMSGTILDTLFSTTNGTFAQFVKVTQTYTRVRYAAYKNGYQPATAMVDVVRDTADCDTITLRPGVTPITSIVQPNTGVRPNMIALYSLKGQLLYCGSELNLNTVLKSTVSLSQPVIAQYMLNNTVLYKRKILLLQ